MHRFRIRLAEGVCVVLLASKLVEWGVYKAFHRVV